MAGSVTYILAQTDKLGASSFQTILGGGWGGNQDTTLYLYDKFPKHPEKKIQLLDEYRSPT